MEFCTCLTPFISLTSSLRLTWLQFLHYLTSNTMSVLLCLAKCACIVERTSNVAYSSNVLELLGDLVLMMAAGYDQYLLLLCKLVSYCVIKHVTSGPVTIHLKSAVGPPALMTAFACSTPGQ